MPVARNCCAASYGNEQNMLGAERHGQSYLFKLRQTTKVQALIRGLGASSWMDAGDGWQVKEQLLKLLGWSAYRRCIFLRRPADRTPRRARLPAEAHQEFAFVEGVDSSPNDEFVVLVTNTTMPVVGLAQLYRDRADCENISARSRTSGGGPGS